MIDGFPSEASVMAGGELSLHVSTDAPAFRVRFLRWGAEVVEVARSGWLAGADVPPHLPHHDWTVDNVGLHGRDLRAWPGHRFSIPSDWAAGVYVAVLESGDGRPHTDARGDPSPDARRARALFVVRRGRSAAGFRLLYKLPVLTYHAYNQGPYAHWRPATGRGGWCLYSDFDPLPISGPPAVSWRRPGGGVGGIPYDAKRNPDPFAATARQTFAHWDAPAVAWLEREGHVLDFCTDLDLHADAGTGRLLGDGGLLLSFGHDEYWTPAMRDAVEAFATRGGNAALFAGNIAWWRVALEDGAFRRDGQWWRTGRPENAMTGVSFRNGGERPPGVPGRPVGYVVRHADHPLYRDTGLRDGDLFGAGEDEHLVGYECDGAAFDRAARSIAATGDDGTPKGFEILAVGDVGAAGWGHGNRAATLGFHTPGGTVFTAATTDWARILARAPDGVVARMTRNVLADLGRPRATAAAAGAGTRA